MNGTPWSTNGRIRLDHQLRLPMTRCDRRVPALPESPPGRCLHPELLEIDSSALTLVMNSEMSARTCAGGGSRAV